MKKMILFAAIINLVFFSATIQSCRDQKYPAGKDTYKNFGDGRFDIGVTSRSSGKKFGLYDIEKQKTIIYDLYSFSEDGSLIYAYGSTNNERYYVILNYDSGEYSKYKSIDEAPAKLRGNLAKLSKSRTLPNRN